jgi:transcription initiation factor TFIID subunit 5
MIDEGKRPYTLFQGHSGPVYSAAFSPFGDFLLSSSSDSTSKILALCFLFDITFLIIFIVTILSFILFVTVRLWSTKLNANLVCYKGHNYPVWDVQVCEQLFRILTSFKHCIVISNYQLCNLLIRFIYPFSTV